MDVMREAVVELRRLIQAHLLDWLAAGATLGVAYGFFGAGIKPTLRYFTPGDPSLSYPDRASTVSGTALYLMVFVLPPGVCLVTHAAGQWLAKRPRPLSLVLLDFHHTMLSLVEAYALAALWKVSLNRGVGRLRPFWLSLVAPNPSPAELSDGRASYPSGHAAYSHFAGAVTCWWLLSTLGVFSSSNVRFRFAKLLLASLPVGLATFVAATRIADYKHHGARRDAASLQPGSRPSLQRAM